MAQTLRIKTAGGLTKLSLSPRIKKSDGYQTRREKKKISTAAQKYVNAKAQHDQLEFLLAANVRPGDWFVTLTYDDQHLPDCWDRADKSMQWFFRKLRESRRPAKTIYFYNIERALGAAIDGTTTQSSRRRSPRRSSNSCGAGATWICIPLSWTRTTLMAA